MEETIIRPIARYYGDLGEKFGVPRQAGVVEELEGCVVFEPAYRDPEALRGMEGFDRLWLIWQFSENLRAGEDWRSGRASLPRCARQGLAAIPGWEFSPPGPPSAPTPWGSAVCGSWGSNRTESGVQCCASAGRI